jgi:divinyl chlorophyllide a 8-vinyl-reductase
LPIGGPGPALTPLDQVAMLQDALARPVRVKRVPIALMDTIIAILKTLGRISPKLAEKANLAEIGRYYGTESMLVWDGRAYDADKTPEYGNDTLRNHYAAVLSGEAMDDLGAHKLF